MLGHVSTITAHLRAAYLPPALPQSERWVFAVEDEVRGRIRLTGWFHRGLGKDIAVLVHGLGGTADSGYVLRFADHCLSRGLSVLRLNLRGADRSGCDFYHAGLSSDIAAVLRSPDVASHRRVFVAGFSLGGHQVLRLAMSDAPATACAALCAPLDLSAGSRFLDHPLRSVYRRHVLRGLLDLYKQVAARNEVPLPVAEAANIRFIHDWDEHIVAPRFGFASAEDYYRAMSAGPALADVSLPTLFLYTDDDPMVTTVSHDRHLGAASSQLSQVRMRRGGHLGFSDRQQVPEKVLDWLVSQNRTERVGALV